MILNRSCDTLDATDEVLKAIYRCCDKYDGQSNPITMHPEHGYVLYGKDWKGWEADA
jgi:hypothetical protein